MSIKPLVSLVVFLLILAPASAVTISTSVTVGGGGSYNFPPTIDNVVPDISLIGNDILMELSVQASDANGFDDIDYVEATLYYENLATLYPSTPNPPRIELDQTLLTLDNTLGFNTGIFTGSLSHQDYKPGFYILVVQVFDKSGASDIEEIDVLTIAGIKGDFSGDGIVNGFDIVHLARHFAGIELNIYSLEVSGDGNLNGYDIVYLASYFAGIDGFDL